MGLARALATFALCATTLAAQAGVVRHLLWDANQRPLYQQCARDFEAQHPHIRIRIQQQGWDEYWTTLSTGFVADTAPDVFTNHLSRYAEFVANGVMADLAPLLRRDGVDTSQYEPGLLPMWQHQGRQYALPADWDTVALVVNLEQLRAAGLEPAALQALHWNPHDGGSLAQVIARLSLDQAGRRGDEPGFDPQRVRQYGYQNPGHGGMVGQTEWSHFAASAGWRYQAAPWDAALRYDDPLLAQTLAWLATLPVRGWSAPPQAVARTGSDALFLAGRVAMVPSGSWMVGHFARHARFAHAWVPLPVGPMGQRVSMRNGLAHSLWAGSRNAAEAWLWLRHLGSRACQARVAEAGVVYPAVQGLAEVALAAQRRMGVDARVFLDTARGSTFAPPVAANAAEINDLLGPVLERILAGRANAATALRQVAPQVRALAAQR